MALTETAVQAGEGADEDPESARTCTPHGRQGRRLLGAELHRWSSTPRRGPATRVFEIDGVKVVVRQEELPLPERHHARLRHPGTDGRLHLHQSPGEVELWLRHLVLGLRARLAPTETTGPAAGPFVILEPRSRRRRVTDYFTVFGLPARSWRSTPPRCSGASTSCRGSTTPTSTRRAAGRAQARGLRVRASSTRAYRALRDPLARVEYLLALEEGRESREGATDKPKAPPRAARRRCSSCRRRSTRRKAEGWRRGDAGRLRERAGAARGARRGRGGGASSGR